VSNYGDVEDIGHETSSKMALRSHHMIKSVGSVGGCTTPGIFANVLFFSVSHRKYQEILLSELSSS